jgi:hypothetical protein
MERREQLKLFRDQGYSLDDALKMWDESKHSRGQPGNAGQFGPGGGGGGKVEEMSNDTYARKMNAATSRKDRDSIKEQWKKQEAAKPPRGGKVIKPAESREEFDKRQKDGSPPPTEFGISAEDLSAEWKPQEMKDSSSYEELKSRGEATMLTYQQLADMGQGVSKRLKADVFDMNQGADFKDAVEWASSSPTGFAVIIAPLTGDERAKDKIANKYGGDASMVTDMVRGTIVCPDYSKVREGVAAFRAEMESRGWTVNNANDRMTEGLPGGYRDINYTVRSPSGHVCEMQFQTPAMLVAKQGEGHKLYEEQRKIEEGLGSRRPTLEEGTRLRDLKSRSAKLYGDAYAKDGGRRAGIRSDRERSKAGL